MNISGNLYEETAPAAPVTHSVNGPHDADFVVIGAGYTGLTAAIHAARQGVKTIVLEAEGTGYGGSGRNHGHCVPVLGFINPEQAIAQLGRERGEYYTRLLAASGSRVFNLIREYNIDCEAAPTGALQLAHSPAAMAGLRKQHDFYDRLGRKPVLLDHEAAVRLTGSQAFHGGWMHPDGGHLNPLAFARGLARAAIQEGASFFTHSPVTSIERQGDSWLVHCPQGTVKAKRVGIATNAYTDRLLSPIGRSYFIMHAYALASEPISGDLRKHILPGNQSVGDTRPDVRYFRFDSQNRLVVGGLLETIRGRNLASTTNFMNKRVKELYPDIGTLRWGWHWSGRLAINMNRRPHLYNPQPGLFALVGYSGRGVPTATALGEILGRAGVGEAPSDLPMEISPLKPLVTAPILSAFVPRLRGPINRIRSRWS